MAIALIAATGKGIEMEFVRAGVSAEGNPNIDFNATVAAIAARWTEGSDAAAYALWGEAYAEIAAWLMFRQGRDNETIEGIRIFTSGVLFALRRQHGFPDLDPEWQDECLTRAVGAAAEPVLLLRDRRRAEFEQAFGDDDPLITLERVASEFRAIGRRCAFAIVKTERLR